jgi:hypothetical protein
MRVRFVVLIVVGALSLGGPVTPARAAGSNIGPNQSFAGRVNGGFYRVTIAMACFGPIEPGETGHPVSGQTLEVIPPPPVAYGPIHIGYTGSTGTSVVVRQGGAKLARLTQYFQMVNIPTTAVFPCAGKGMFRFVPKPISSDSLVGRVSVRFVGQP